MKSLSVVRGTFQLFFVGLFLFSFFATHSFANEKDEMVVVIGDKSISKNGAKSNELNAINEGPSILIRLSAAHFDPLRSLPVRQEQLSDFEMYEEGEIGYFIIQFDGPIKKSWKTSLEGMGVVIFDYVPDFAFIIKMDSGIASSVSSLSHVRWLGIYQPSYRLSQGALDKALIKREAVKEGTTSQEDVTSLVDLRVTAFPGESLERLRTEIAACGGVIVDTVETKWKTSFKVGISPDRIVELAAISGVKWIEPMPEWKLFNNVSTDIMNVRTPRDNHGLYGAGQTVGVCDTGLDQGVTNPGSLHDDFEDGAGASRVTTIFDRVGDGASDVNSGHGTHVAGSVLGNGLMSGSNPISNSFPFTSFAGTAPKANLVFQAVENNSSGSLSGIPIDLNELFSEAEGAGADMHTNSWGATLGGTYNSSAEDVDEYMWNHPGFLILFAAGNDGVDKDGDGVIDLFSLGSPATAKNCLTVGASEGNRPSGAGYDIPWGTGSWAYKYSALPISSDHVSDDPLGMAAFSSRGPTLDGRHKPDLVAPGTNILSTRSSMASGTGWGPYNNDYMWMGGTSMSTPLTAGAAALIREYLISVKGFTDPSAALIKASLLGGAEDIAPGQYGTGSTQEIPDSPVPNNVEGWGRVNIGDSVYPTSPFNRFYFDEQNSLNTGEYRDYIINASSSNSLLKVNLVWTDYPGTPAAQGTLVNDLDLQLTGPSSMVQYPDHASQNSTVNQLSYDSDNSTSASSNNRRAIRFTPAAYPVNLESTTFYFNNPNSATNDVDVVVYDDDGANGLPGTELFRKILTFVPSGWITVGITGVAINSGDFYVAIEKSSASQSILIDVNSNPTGRSYWHNGIDWAVSIHTAYIRASVRGTDYSTSFDRVNNAVGLTLANPAAGSYSIRVSGYNVPHGPQPYALVISCEDCSVSGQVKKFPWSMYRAAMTKGKE